VRRVVIDSNVLISARLSPRGSPGRLLAAWLDGRFELIVSPALLTELAGVLERPKFRRWVTVEEARAFVQMLRISATILNDPPEQQHDLRDPDDSYLVTLARSAKVEYLVSGDGDLTSLQSPQPPVITPADFLADLGRSK
jgi:putative PIN family toxin of toxin-antitoxin system